MVLLENRNVTLLIAISHVIESPILNDHNYLFNYIAQSNYYILKFLTAIFLKH